MLKVFFAAAALMLTATPVFAADPDCGDADLVRSARLPLAFCVDPQAWQPSEGSGAQEFVYFSRDGKAGFALVSEGSAGRMDAFHDKILDFATRQSAAPAPIASSDDASHDLGGRTWQSMHYIASVQGQQIEYLNYFYSSGDFGSAQLIFWSAPADAREVESRLASDLLETVTVTK